VITPGLVTQGVGAARQRALLRNIATTKAAQQLTTNRLSSANKPYYADVMARPSNSKSSNYFAQRIQESRQRALLANIASTKATQTQTKLSSLARAASAVAAAAKPVAANSSEPQNFFAQRILAARQSTLLNNIASTKATQTLTSLPRALTPVQSKQQEYFRQRIAEAREQASVRVAASRPKAAAAPSKPVTPPKPAPLPNMAMVAPKPQQPVAPKAPAVKMPAKSADAKVFASPKPEVSSIFDSWESPMTKPFKPAGTPQQAWVPKFIPPSTTNKEMKSPTDQRALQNAVQMSEQAKKELEYAKKDMGSFAAPKKQQQPPWGPKKPTMQGIDANSVKDTAPQQPWAANKAADGGPAISKPFAPQKAADLKQAFGTPTTNNSFASKQVSSPSSLPIALKQPFPAAQNPFAAKPAGPAAPNSFVPEPSARPLTGYPWEKKKDAPTTPSNGQTGPSTPRALWQRATMRQAAQGERAH